MNDQSDSILKLLATVLSDPQEYARQLDEFRQRRVKAEEAELRSKEAVLAGEKELEKIRSDSSLTVATLAQRKAEHDASAKEAATRIELANSHAKELLRLQQELQSRDDELSARERALASRAAEVNAVNDRMHRWEAILNAKEADLRSRHQKFLEATS